MEAFGTLVEKGFIYRGLKPVNWCYRCETALAEAEVEYEDHTSPSIFVKFPLEPGKDFLADSFLVIWTTTPWTLIANVAAAVHPDFTYSYIRTAKGNLIVANVRMGTILPLLGIEKFELIREFKGRELERAVYSHPFGLRKGTVVLADYVSAEEGSGLVHTAPGHGNEDYLTGVKYGLEIIMPVDGRGNFDSSAGEFAGMNVHESNAVILQKLEGLGLLLHSDKIRHSYPHCWRCKHPVIFRATNQWFLKVDRKEGQGTFRDALVRAVKETVRWIPQAGQGRIAAMVGTRPDWCLSRQRYWGVPIPSVICKKCGEEFLDAGVIRRFAELTAKEGTDCWFARDVKDFIPAGLSCTCGSKEFSRGQDILDVWFDSGASSQAVLKVRPDLEYPASLYLEGSDQHRGWFQASLIVGMGVDGKPPFKNVLTHGFVVDGEGRKMSKSTGNVVSPFDVIKNSGADILRLWAASSDYNEDIRVSNQIITRLSEAYRKIRNTCRFMLSNLNDFDPDTDSVGYADLKRIDRWVLRRTEVVRDLVTRRFEEFEFNLAFQALYNFCNEELSMYYLDMAKGRLYTAGKGSPERRACQTAMYTALDALMRMTAPILVFTSDEIWRYLPKRKKEAQIQSVHLLPWPQPNAQYRDEGIEKEMGPVLELLPGITKALEEKRSSGEIGSSFDAKIILLTKDENRYKYLGSLGADLAEIFKVSQVETAKSETMPDGADAGTGIGVRVEKADGAKCERCWNYSGTVGKDAAHPALCGKCRDVVNRSA